MVIEGKLKQNENSFYAVVLISSFIMWMQSFLLSCILFYEIDLISLANLLPWEHIIFMDYACNLFHE